MKITNTEMTSFLKTIVNINTLYYKEDFKGDVKILQGAEKCSHTRRYLWMSRSSGTWCFKESEVYLKGACANGVWPFYRDDMRVIPLLLDIKKVSGERIFGDIIILDYEKHLLHVSEKEIPWFKTKYTFSDGFEAEELAVDNSSQQVLNERFGKVHGDVIDVHCMPQDIGKLDTIIRNNKLWEKRQKEISAEKFISQLGGKDQLVNKNEGQ